MNKNALVLITLLTIPTLLIAQSPQSFRYLAAVQDSEGESLVERSVTFIITILAEGMPSTRVYSEFHNATTDQFGMVSLNIGEGNPIFRSFSQVQWGSGGHSLKVEMDEEGGTNFKLLNEVELLSVPYALYAENARYVDDADADPDNEIQELSLEGDQLSITQGNSVTISPNTDNQTLAIDGHTLTISNGNSVELPSMSDGLPNPELPVPVPFRGHYIYAHPQDNSDDVIFGAFTLAGATSDSDGEVNTQLLVEALGDASYAAKICDDLVAFGFDDWYLPSRAELDAIFKQNYLISGYSLDDYWSSTETATNMAYTISFESGALNSPTKNQARRCRCVRKN